MKSKYPIEVIDLGHQLDGITPKEIQSFEECRNDPAKARIFVILIRYWQIETLFGSLIKKTSFENRARRFRYSNNPWCPCSSSRLQLIEIKRKCLQANW